MRVISGKYRGKKLMSFDIDTTRPTSDNVKESVFNIIGRKVIGCTFLDLFAGTGGMGIEAISRGAESVVMVDANRKAISLILKNLDRIEGNYLVKNADSIKFIQKTDKKYDIIFIDPPYAGSLVEDSLNAINEKNILNDDGVVLVESEREIKGEDYGYGFTKHYKYGRKIITLMIKEKEDEN